MIEFIINPEKYREIYLQNLNICFPNWGNNTLYDWVFERKINNKKADLFVMKSQNDEILAGSAVTYRNIQTSNNKLVRIGIMTGSWTLPISRGLGCFSKAIIKSQELAINNEAAFLVAFVTKTNASFRRLRDAGSLLIETNYIISQSLPTAEKGETKNIVQLLPKTEQNIEEIFELRQNKLKHQTHFKYNLKELESQFFSRTGATFLLQVGKERVIIEETESIIQLHFSTNYSSEIISIIAHWANVIKGKEIIFFISNELVAFQSSQFKIIEGYFTVLDNSISKDVKIVDFQNIHIDYGDKM